MESILYNYLKIFIIYFPLGVIGIWRWSVWIIKKIIAKKYAPITSEGTNSQMTLSIVTPVYNEDPQVFKNAINSWKENNPEEIIAVIDESDKNCIEEFKKFGRKFKNARLIITKERGKRPALLKGTLKSKGDVIALVDSDTIWNKNIREKILAPFNDPAVGGVATRQKVLKADTLARILFDIHLDTRYLLEMPYLAASGNALTCVSGRTAVYRREALMPIIEEMTSETFMGKKCVSGEDKCLTRLALKNQWKLRYQKDAVVYTPGADNIITFFKQQTRWQRNSWRSDLKSLTSKWILKEKWLMAHMIDRFIQPFTLILGPIYFILSLFLGHYIVAAILVSWWCVSRSIKIFPHLKERPFHILFIPVYIISVYILGVIKIYTLVTISKQGWITRWDKSRLEKLRFINLIPSYAGTMGIIFFISLGVVNYNQTFASPLTQNNLKNGEYGLYGIPYSNTGGINTETTRQNILTELSKPQFGHYTIKRGDTIRSISKKYNADYEKILLANKNIKDPLNPPPGSQIKIPVEELRNAIDETKIISFKDPVITYDKKDNIIFVDGKGSAVNLSSIQNSLQNKKLIENLGNKEWILRASLFLGKDTTIVISDEEVKWLKLRSEKNDFAILRSYNGNVLIKNTKITSWSELTGEPDTDPVDGRALILAKYDARMDVINSEIAYLGYGYYGLYTKRGQPFGGSYGVSWKIPADSYKKYLITGNFINNKLHNNYFGLYTYGATGMIIKNNEVYDNIEYGLDPHDDSNNFLIENNVVRSNGNHGIIISKRCFNNIFRNNIVYENKLHGIMLDRKSNNNLVENNIIYKNTDGIAIYDSHNNLIQNNDISENTNGVRANVNSSQNLIQNNRAIKNVNGIFLYNEANENYVENNIIEKNAVGIYIKNAADNLVRGSLIKGDNKTEIKISGENNEKNKNAIAKILINK